MLSDAPFFAEVADAPPDAQAYWVTASDGVRLRVAAMGTSGQKGTVLLFPGRTEYVEKYGRAARDFFARGYATLTVDWRGQGLADRLLDNPMPGHVDQFSDYQHDVSAVLDAAEQLDLPKPYFLLAHSMGGAIGLRAIYDGLPVAACGFSGPMWGIELPSVTRLLARCVAWGAIRIGLGHVYAPGTGNGVYVLTEPFDSNALTSDRGMYSYMSQQSGKHSDLNISGPTLRWLHEALHETAELAKRPPPDMPCLCLTGTKETIVDVRRIRARMADWQNGKLDMIEGAKHEVMMEDAATRKHVFDALDDHYSAHLDRLDQKSPKTA